jgi:hypothetical protein
VVGEAVVEGEGVAVGVDVFVKVGVEEEVTVGGVVPFDVFVLVTCGVIVGLLGTHNLEPALMFVEFPRQFAHCSSVTLTPKAIPRR